MTRGISRNNRKLPKIRKIRENNKNGRIAQVSLQARIDNSERSTTARSETRENSNTTTDASWSQ